MKFVCTHFSWSQCYARFIASLLIYAALLFILQRCVQCSGSSATCETVGSDGPGVNDADYILYVGTNTGGSCTTNGVLAFANLCQMETTMDR